MSADIIARQITVIARQVIRQAITDLCGDDPFERESASEYVFSKTFRLDCTDAGYPEVLFDTLKELMILSGIERKFLRRKILGMLSDR